jgi:hypothetical protein
MAARLWRALLHELNRSQPRSLWQWNGSPRRVEQTAGNFANVVTQLVKISGSQPEQFFIAHAGQPFGTLRVSSPIAWLKFGPANAGAVLKVSMHGVITELCKLARLIQHPKQAGSAPSPELRCRHNRGPQERSLRVVVSKGVPERTCHILLVRFKVLSEYNEETRMKAVRGPRYLAYQCAVLCQIRPNSFRHSAICTVSAMDHNR